MAKELRIYTPSGRRKIAMTTMSLFAIAFGVFMYSALPGLIGQACLVISIVAVVFSVTNTLRLRLTWGDGVVGYRALFGSWSVPVSQIERWKLRQNPAGSNTSFELNTSRGEKHQIADMSLLSIESYKDFSREFAQLLKDSRAASVQLGSAPN